MSTVHLEVPGAPTRRAFACAQIAYRAPLFDWSEATTVAWSRVTCQDCRAAAAEFPQLANRAAAAWAEKFDTGAVVAVAS